MRHSHHISLAATLLTCVTVLLATPFTAAAAAPDTRAGERHVRAARPYRPAPVVSGLPAEPRDGSALPGDTWWDAEPWAAALDVAAWGGAVAEAVARDAALDAAELPAPDPDPPEAALTSPWFAPGPDAPAPSGRGPSRSPEGEPGADREADAGLPGAAEPDDPSGDGDGDAAGPGPGPAHAGRPGHGHGHGHGHEDGRRDSGTGGHAHAHADADRGRHGDADDRHRDAGTGTGTGRDGAASRDQDGDRDQGRDGDGGRAGAPPAEEAEPSRVPRAPGGASPGQGAGAHRARERPPAPLRPSEHAGHGTGGHRDYGARGARGPLDRSGAGERSPDASGDPEGPGDPDDLYAPDGTDAEAGGPEQPTATTAPQDRVLPPLLPLGAGMASIGLGLGFLGLRLRRG